MQVYRSRIGDHILPLAYYLDDSQPVASAAERTAALRAVDPEKHKLQGFTFFECIAEEKCFPILATFLMSGVDPNAAQVDAVGATGLHIAARHGNLLAINFLLDNGANINATTRGGQTPLMWAVNKGQLDTITLLIRRGADATLCDEDNNSVVSFASDSAITLHALRKVLDVPAIAKKEQLLHRLCKTPNSRFTVLYCIEHLGLDVHERDLSGRTPLHLAAMSGDVDLVKTLLSKGADPSAVDERGQRPDTQLGISSAIKSLLQKFESEGNNTVKDKLTKIDFSNYSRVNLTQVKHFAVAFFIPNLVIMAGTSMHVAIGFIGLFLCAVGFTMVAQFGMGQKGRSMATAGWFSGALFFGGSVVVRQILPSYALERPDSYIPFVWWTVTVIMFYCYARAVLADPGVVQSTAEGRKTIYEYIEHGEAEIQQQGIDLTSMVKKPLRSKHCSKTGQCVYRFDHYCVWTGNAIGGGNHRFFVLYCLFQFMSQFLVGYTTLTYLLVDGPKRAEITGSFWSKDYMSFLFSQENALVVFFLVFYNTFVFLFVSSVLVGQLWYATRNVTSNEVWFPERYKWMFKLGKRAFSLYDNGWQKNVVEFFWSGNLCADLYTVPPMNDYLKKICQRYASIERNKQLNQQPREDADHCESGLSAPAMASSQPAGGAFDYASAVAQLPQHVQDEMAIVQSMLQKMISQGATEGIEIPASVPAERRDHVLHQAKTMFNHFHAAMQRNKQQQERPVQQVSLISDEREPSPPATAIVDMSSSAPAATKRAARKDD